MRILVAADENPYSKYAAREAARLAINTWADVTILGVQAPPPAKEGASQWLTDHPLNLALHRYREDFLKGGGGEESPYAMDKWQYEWLPVKTGLWEELLVCRGARKDLKVHLRAGNIAQGILAEAREEEADLVILGCTKGEQCQWAGPSPVPQGVVSDADCSVLLVKEEQSVTGILACLDQSYISQDSLEMINQMATIHKAKLELIGLSQEGAMKRDVYRRLIEIGDYYEDRQIEVKTRLTPIADFESFVGHELKQNLLALWMGKRSLLDRFFPRDWVGRFVSKCQTSVLIMR
jgi:nucleotide-binding universal stress UspA family protein